MEDNSFDKQIKSVLEEYDDTTPSNLGWQRFQGKYGQTVGISGIQRWLKLSAVANVLLTGTVVWLLWNVDLLQDRITTLEKRQPATTTIDKKSDEVHKASEGKATTIAGNSTDADASERLNEQQETPSSAASTSMPRTSTRKPELAGNQRDDASTAPRKYAADDARETSYKPIRKSPSYRLNAISGLRPVTIHLAFVKVWGEANEIIPGNVKPMEAHLPLQTVLALEKSKMGNKIGWAFGLTGGLGMANLGTGYQGVGIQNGIVVGALIHPLWGVESGISLDQTLASTRNIDAGAKAWQSAAGVPPTNRIDKLALHLQTLEVPLLVRLRFPVTDRKSWFASIGLVQNFRLSEKQTFYIRRLEDHEEEEDHYELAEREFSNKGIGSFYTGFTGELGISKQIKALPLRWQLGAYYKHQIGRVSGGFQKAEMVGIKGALRFSRW
ncbi:MAG: outer membrane beta-barrel protein [Imperialibacter sp.]|uniref:hypothetical protein n=1 Tax=Imperialibacter sp. TaxID=2038411 RepID=UPI0032EE07BE